MQTNLNNTKNVTIGHYILGKHFAFNYELYTSM